MDKKQKFKSISLPEPYYGMATELAKKENRSLSNYLQTIISKHYEKVKFIAVLAMLLFASCAKQTVEPTPQPIPDPVCYDCVETWYQKNANLEYIFAWDREYVQCDTTKVGYLSTEGLDGLTGKYTRKVRVCERID